jgi:hypothetical protein
MNAPLTEEEFKAALPAHVKKSVNKRLIDGINRVLADPKALDFLRDNILGYTQVMKEGKFKIIQYLNAVHYVSHKLMGCTNQTAYIKTFPDKYARWLREGVTEKTISAYASAYNGTKLVNLIYEQTLIPAHVLNAPMFQQALNTQAELMLNAKSEKVRSDAANSILTHLKRPETVKMELDVGVKQDSTVEALRQTTLALVQEQRAALAKGTHSVKQIAESPLVMDVEED